MKKFQIMYSRCDILINTACPKNVTSIFIEEHSACSCNFKVNEAPKDFVFSRTVTNIATKEDSKEEGGKEEGKTYIVFISLSSLSLIGVICIVICRLVNCPEKPLKRDVEQCEHEQDTRQFRAPSPLLMTNEDFGLRDRVMKDDLPSGWQGRVCQFHEAPSPLSRLRILVNEQEAEENIYMSMRRDLNTTSF